MSLALFFKNNLKNIHPVIGQQINRLPYSVRPGISEIYRARAREIKTFESFPSEGKQKFIFSRIKALVHFAFENIPFYKEYYNKLQYNPDGLQRFEDIQEIPIVNKSILNNYDIEYRSAKRKSRYLVNTGGSSGTPFAFYIEPSSIGHEWAHMHTIWRNLGYRPHHFKLLFGGRSDLLAPIEYDVLRNHFVVDIYKDYELIAQRLLEVVDRYNVKYLHGYPSAIYDFACYCVNENVYLKNKLIKCLRGIFLGSEFPHPTYRTVIENTFKVKTVSWYGHTERCILAFERHHNFEYEPLQTYGFTEALPTDNDDYKLVGTSYYNFATPFIRYDTGDLISNLSVVNGLLAKFSISKGREGEFVLDKNGKKISLTGLIFGRHHELFNYTKFLQVKQISIGKIVIYFVAETLSNTQANELFDTSNLNFDIDFVKIDQPVRSPAGKINLLIR